MNSISASTKVPDKTRVKRKEQSYQVCLAMLPHAERSWKKRVLFEEKKKSRFQSTFEPCQSTPKQRRVLSLVKRAVATSVVVTTTTTLGWTTILHPFLHYG